MYHHDGRQYDVAKSEAADKARAKFQAILDRGVERGAKVFQKLEEQPQDRIVNTRAFKFEPDDNGVVIDIDGDKFNMHKHALNQAVTKTGILTQGMSNKILDVNQPWANEMLADVLNRTYQNTKATRALVRAVDGEIRGVLSDKYRRMDSGPIFESFIREAMTYGAVPTDGNTLATKNTLTMMLPHIFEPVKNEVMLFGATLSNSDFGDGALSLKFSLLRIWCTNMAMRDECMRKVHLGKRLDENIKFSDNTYRLDTETMASAVKDLMENNLSPDRVNQEMKLISAAAEETVDIAQVFKNLQKSGKVTKAEQASLVEVYNTPDVEMLPPGNNLWRASNALSLFSQKESVTPSRGLELQQIAGDILEPMMKRIQVSA